MYNDLLTRQQKHLVILKINKERLTLFSFAAMGMTSKWSFNGSRRRSLYCALYGKLRNFVWFFVVLHLLVNGNFIYMVVLYFFLTIKVEHYFSSKCKYGSKKIYRKRGIFFEKSATECNRSEYRWLELLC